MATNPFFHFNRGIHISTNLPLELQDKALYDGTFRLNGKPVVSSMHRQNAQRSGMLTNASALALARAMMVANGSDHDAFGSNNRASMTEVTLNDNFNGTTVGNGKEMLLVIKKDPKATKRIMCSLKPNEVQESWPFLFCLMDEFLENQEFMAAFNTMCHSSSVEDLEASAIICADIMYYMINDMNLTDADVATMGTLSKTQAASSTFAPESFTGVFTTFTTNGRRKTAKKAPVQLTDPKAMNGKYRLVDPATLTPEERALIPVLDDRYVITEKVEEIAASVKWGIEQNVPMNFNNILLRSAPGYGKSTIYVILAAAFGLPLHSLGLNAMSDPIDLIGSFVPQTGGQRVSARQYLGKELPFGRELPAASEICIDPEAAYKAITGQGKPGATEFDCMSAIVDLAIAKAQAENAANSEEKESGRQKVVFVPGIIPAMQRPCMIGLDEVSMPMNAGVVPTLHPLMDGINSFQLPNGETIHRHPLSIMVGTTNIGLEGNRAINQAFSDRNSLIVDLDAPDDAELKARMVANTGFNQSKYPHLNLDLFIRCFHEMEEVAKARRLNDGVIGPRKLDAWLFRSMFTGDPKRAAEDTIITGATADKDGQQSLREKVEALF